MKRVGIVGGGAAGVIAAKCLREAGHSVVVFEKGAQVGGVWRYTDATNTDASMYKSLRTNLPTSVMQLDDFPFPPTVRSFPSHTAVLEYIQRYAEHFKVLDVTRFHSTVTGIRKTSDEEHRADPAQRGSWRVGVASRDRGVYEEAVDKVLICNGHFAVPAFAPVRGVEHFKGMILHSHDYRTPDAFVGKSVLLIGKGPSGQDISLELVAAGAKEVIVSFKEEDEAPAGPDNDRGAEPRVLKGTISHVASSGDVVFNDGSVIPAPDVLMYCTGYLYTVKHLLPSSILYPELDVQRLDALTSDHRRALEAATAQGSILAPLYKQFFSIEEPDIAFVGLPFKNLPFLCFELQSKWAARVFAGEVPLPSQQQMYQSLVDEVRALPFPIRKLHQLGGARQAKYFDELASMAEAKCDPQVQAMFADAGMLRSTYPLYYREAEYTKNSASGRWQRRLSHPHPTHDGAKAREDVQHF